ncbi:MAG: hypothetical protein IT305_12130, partial [Chloroflexi bacterium]|nr:hypothetical protein [Chloroflexota bacterium]
MTVPTHSTAVETGPLARSLADAYRQLVEFHRDQLKTTFPEADAAARQATAHDLERLSAKDPGELSWFDLNRLA